MDKWPSYLESADKLFNLPGELFIELANLHLYVLCSRVISSVAVELASGPFARITNGPYVFNLAVLYKICQKIPVYFEVL